MRIAGVISVQNCGSSGSLLMQSLLDSHPNMLNLPALHGHQLYNFWLNNQQLPGAQLREKFAEAHAYWFDPSVTEDLLGLQQMGPEFNQPTKVDRDTFLRNLGWDDHQTLARADYIRSVYTAYTKTLGRPLDQESYWIVFPIHGQDLAHGTWLTEDFPKVYFLHTVREPIQNMGSGAKHMSKYPWLGCFNLIEANVRQILLEEAIHVGTMNARGMHAYFPDSANVQSRSVRLEDLHKNSEAATRAIAQWLNVPWTPELMKSTFDGKIWNNRPETTRQAGLGAGTISKKHADLYSAFDRWRLKQLARPIHLYYGYSAKKDFAPVFVRKFVLPLLLLWPYRMEFVFSQPRRVRAWVAYRYQHATSRRWQLLKDGVPLSMAQTLGSVAVTLKCIYSSRKALLRCWKKSFTDDGSSFVPPVFKADASATPAESPQLAKAA